MMLKNSELSDNELLEMISNADRGAYESLFNRYYHRLLKYAGRVVYNQEEAEDIVQEVFYAVWDNRAKSTEIHSISAYLYGAIRFRALKYVRANIYKNKYITSLGYFFKEGYNNIHEQLDAKELDGILRNEINKLPPKMREVFVLSRIEHLSHKEIAERLNISEHTVKKQINNALNLLRVLLDEQSGNLAVFILIKFLIGK